MARVLSFPQPFRRASPRPVRRAIRVASLPAAVAPPISNAQLGMVIFIAFETMMFVGLITAYWVLRTNSFVWPPPSLPRLPLAVTWVNTAMLLLSALTMSRASAALRAHDQHGFRIGLLATAVLGVGFLAVQGTEWLRLIRRGLTLSSGSYGATFYTLIGLHALHVIGAVLWLVAVMILAQRDRFSAEHHSGVTTCGMYWYFVCVLWVVLFVAVYLY